jgi:hypothetical protein
LPAPGVRDPGVSTLALYQHRQLLIWMAMTVTPNARDKPCV